jgi:hypothetical protein
MRTLSTLAKAVLSGANVPVKLIARFFLGSGDYFVSNDTGDWTWNNGATGNVTYTGLGPSFGAQLPATQAQNQTTGPAVKLSGADVNILSTFYSEEYRARPIEVALLLVDPTTGLPGDEILIASGTGDTAQLDDDPAKPAEPGDVQTATLTVQIAPKTVDLGRAGQRVACDLDQKLYRDAADEFFQDTHNISVAQINWGVAGPNSPAGAAPQGNAFKGVSAINPAIAGLIGVNNSLFGG